tara:strand:+ start:576 stop:1883 length:1308 start_codon:yes stop_codon:yes gene_type:complete
MNISVFGLGYVGCVSLGCLAKQGHQVIGVDVNLQKVELINNGKPTIIEKDIAELIIEQHLNKRISATTDFKLAIDNSDISIICVGTPLKDDGKLSMEYINRVSVNIADALINKNSFHTIVVRSTIIPGTAKNISNIIEKISGKTLNKDFTIVINPEFLREGTSIFDYFNPPLTIIGYNNDKGGNLISSLYNNLPGKILMIDVEVAEIMKYVNNTFHALKVSFANEVGNICKSANIDSQQVMDILCQDKKLNISSYYLKPGFAYGGSCLPKDLKAFQSFAKENGQIPHVINSISKTNIDQIKKAIELINSFEKQNICFLGLSFKEGTDDLRNSPTIKVLDYFISKKYNIKVCDKNVEISKLTGTNKNYIESEIPKISKLIESDIEEAVNQSDLIVICNKEEIFIDVLLNVFNKPIVDLVYLSEKLRNRDNYFGLSW